MTINITDADLPTNIDDLPALKSFLGTLQTEAVREGGNDINAVVVAASRAFKTIDDRIAALEQK